MIPSTNDILFMVNIQQNITFPGTLLTDLRDPIV